MSPRRYAGWEPRTRYTYDPAGRVSHTTPEPEWSEFDQVLIDELLNWQAGVHNCGHHESEQLDPETVFVGGYTICKACEALQRAQEEQAQLDKPARQAGRNPDYPRWWRVWRRTRTELQRRAVERAGRKSPQQMMNEALAKLDSGDRGEEQRMD